MNVLQISVSAGILILIIVSIRALAINKLPKTMFIILWGIALGRLLIPLSIPSKFSLYDLIDPLAKIFSQKPEAISARIINNLLSQHTGSIEGVYKTMQVELVMSIWIVGTAFLALFFAASFYISYREIQTSLPIKGNALIGEWLSRQKIHRSIRIMVSDKITTPLTYGIIKPKIVLPKLMDYSNELQMKHILTHELIHIKRFDALWKIGLIIALCLHWFNPMVWVLYVLMNRDLEITCDEKVIKLFGDTTKSDYALSLIEMAERRTKFTPLYSSFSKNATEERIVSVMKFKKTSLFSLVLAFILVVGATSVFAKSVQELYGIIQTNGGDFNFYLDAKGILTVEDFDGKVISTATIGSDGKATLTDGSGKIIETLQLVKTIPAERIRAYSVAGKSSEDKYIGLANNNNNVALKIAKGRQP